MKQSIYLIDDHPIVIEGLSKIINAQEDMQVVGASGDPQKALQDIKKLKPAVVVLDLSLGDRSGLDLIKALKEAVPTSAVLVYSMHSEGVYAERCLRAGAMGYLMKGETLERIVQGIRQVVGGSFCFSTAVLSGLISGGTGERGGASRGEPGRMLSDRQLEVFEMVGRGLDSHEIAEKTGLSSKTVDAHKANIRQKLGLGSARELLMEALRWVEK